MTSDDGGGSRYEVPRVLVIDDDPGVSHSLVAALELTREYQVLSASNGAQARDLLDREPIDIVITDLKMPDIGGLELMEWARQHSPGKTWIILCGEGTFGDAVKAIQLGAFNFLSKPLAGRDELLVTLRNAADQADLPLCVQGVGPAMRAQFEELGMHRVIERITSEMHPMPDRMEAMETSSANRDQARRRMLFAHQALAHLNERNREEFMAALEALENEEAAQGTSPVSTAGPESG